MQRIGRFSQGSIVRSEPNEMGIALGLCDHGDGLREAVHQGKVAAIIRALEKRFALCRQQILTISEISCPPFPQ